MVANVSTISVNQNAISGPNRRRGAEERSSWRNRQVTPAVRNRVYTVCSPDQSRTGAQGPETMGTATKVWHFVVCESR